MGLAIQVTMPKVSGLSADVITNTFAIGGVGGDAPAATLDALLLDIATLYTGTFTGQTHALGSYLGNGVSRAADACQVRAYDIGGTLDGSPHGSPVRSSTFTLPAPIVANSLPEEVAMVMTLEAHNRASQRVEVPDGVDPDTKRDRPRQRFTGRVFLGPLVNNGDVMTQDATTKDVRLAFNIRVDAQAAFDAVIDGIKTNPPAFMGVWSRKDRAIREIDAISTDDAFDTQRRRGPKATARGRLVVTPTGATGVELAA